MFILIHMHVYAERHIPDLLDIMVKVRSKWRLIGRSLDIMNGRLDEIEQENVHVSERFYQVLYSCQKNRKLTKKILYETLSRPSMECDEQVIKVLRQWDPSANRERVNDCDTSYNEQGISTFLQLDLPCQ